MLNDFFKETQWFQKKDVLFASVKLHRADKWKNSKFRGKIWTI